MGATKDCQLEEMGRWSDEIADYCQRCNGTRVVEVLGKVQDMCHISYEGLRHDGYVPPGFPFSGEYRDYLEFSLCMECGQMQGSFPRLMPDIWEIVEKEEC